MKNLTKFCLIITLLLSGCDKFDPLISSRDNSFSDFDYTAVYFPLQYPTRTIDLSTDARIDNSVDLEHRFHIGISMGGVYKNTKERKVRFEYDPSLLPDNLRALSSRGKTIDSIILLPSAYYELISSSGSFVTIPEQQFTGLIEVQLNDAFFEDSLSLLNTYVIPLKITEAMDIDSILKGLPVVPDPVKTSSIHWDANVPPRDFTLFMVKFINAYHGDYLIRGVDYKLDNIGNRMDATVYRDRYIEKNKIVKLISGSLTEVITNHTGSRISDDGKYRLLLDVDKSGSVSVESMPGALFVASGSGTFLTRDKSTEVWGGESRRTFQLHYNYLNGTENHEVFDTIVFRHTGTVLEWFTPF
ncbi:MAG: DUF1735 domain-containing protein [Bacteroidales bacterium]|nr:DUF1735 domain-containing protein [Bacteroidales bacterium]